MSSLGGGLRNIDWSHQRLEKFEKNFYIEDKKVAARSDREIEEYRRVNEMKVCRLAAGVYITSESPPLPGRRSQCSETCHELRRSWISRLSSGHHPRPGLPVPDAHPVPGLADGLEWTRCCRHRPNW